MKQRIKRRLLSVLLTVCMSLSLFSGTAQAALGNTVQNQSLQQLLENFTGESYEEAYELLSALGLLDENGNLITDERIVLDGVAYTLEEIEELLSDPSTDLSRVAEVDGVPIALRDLQTIIAIERELQYLQGTYFSGATFEGESLKNVNDLLAQLQAQGLTLRAAPNSDQIVFDASQIKQSEGAFYISTAEQFFPAGTEISVKFKFQRSDAIAAMGQNSGLGVYFSTNLYSDWSLGDQSDALIYDMSAAEGQEYTLTAKFQSNYQGTLNLCLRAPNLSATSRSFPQLSYGDIFQFVSFYGADGLVFQNGDSLSDRWNGYFSTTNAEPPMTSSASLSEEVSDVLEISSSMDLNLISFPMAKDDDLDALEQTLTYLQQCIDGLNADNAIRVHVSATIKQENTDDYNYVSGTQHRNLIVPLEVFLGLNSYIDANGVTGIPLNLASGGGTADISFNMISTTMSYSVYPLAFLVKMPFCREDTVTWDQFKDGDFEENYTYYVDGFTGTTTKANFSLVNNGESPNLRVTAREGTYQSGDVIPITITADEYIKAGAGAKVNINGYDYLLSDLHSSTSGKYISFFYEVKEFDAGGLTVSIPKDCGITDYFGNGNKELTGNPIANVNLDTPVLRNAVTALSASYDTDAEALNFSITANQDGRYQDKYGNTADPFQLLVSVGDEEPVSHPVTVSEGAGGTFAFTAELFSVPRTNDDQTVTVQIQAKDGNDWVTVNWLTTTANVPKMVKVNEVKLSVKNAPPDYDYVMKLDDGDLPQLEATVSPADATYTTGSWHSTDESVATIDQNGQIALNGSAVGPVSFYYVADNGTPEDPSDDVFSEELPFTVSAGDRLTLLIPKYAQDSLVQGGSDATLKWNTNVFIFYEDEPVTFYVKLYEGEGTSGRLVNTYTVENPVEQAEKITSCTISAGDLSVTYPQSKYTVEVSMESPEARSAQASITVLAPPTELRLTAKTTTITDNDTLDLTCSISNPGATGTLSATRMMDGEETAVSANGRLSNLHPADGETVTFTPETVSGDGLYDTYTITYTEDAADSADFVPSSDSIVVRVYRYGALSIQSNGEDVDTIPLSNSSTVDGSSGELPQDSEGILALREELGLIEYVSINADDYNWSSFRDGIEWVSDHPKEVGVYYRQGGLWDNIKDLSNETYLPQSQMAVSAMTDGTAIITATHAATGMSDKVTVEVETLRDKFYLFQAIPAERTAVTYTNGDHETRTVYTNDDGLLALYEPSGITSDVLLSSGPENNPSMATIKNSALSSGERDAAKLQLYPLNSITLRPAAEVELYLVEPDGTPYANQSVTLRGGVYLADLYAEGTMMGSKPGDLRPGDEDNTYPTDGDGKLTVYMDATQFVPDGYDGLLTNADLDYWFELSDLTGDQYYPTLVNVEGYMSADYTLRTGSAVVTLREVPAGEEGKPFLISQTLSYARESGDDLQVRNVLGSTGNVGPNSTFQYTELTSRIMLWGVDTADGNSTVSMTGENGFAPEGQTVDVNTFPFASIPIVTNTMVLTKETMTDSGWLKPETAATLRASVYQNGLLLRNVPMSFQVIDLTDVQLVDVDAGALVVEMQGSFLSGVGKGGSNFSFGPNSVGNSFSGKITNMLNELQKTSSPMFRILITPTADNTVFNVIVWGGYNSLDMEDFDYSSTGLAMDYGLMEPELNVGVPPLNDLSDMAKGTYDPIGTVNETKYNRTNSGLDIGAQLEGYYEGQFYYDTDLHEWAFRTMGGGMSAGASLSFQANLNAWVGPVPVTATFGAGMALQLDFKAATVYTDQQDEETLATWTDEAKDADSVNDYLTTLRMNGYVSAFGGIGFDYSLIALKIGLFGKLSGDSTNTFLSQTYLKENAQRNGQTLKATGEVGIKFYAKFLFVSYEAVIGSGRVSYSDTFNEYKYIDNYWNGSGSASGSSSGFSASGVAPTLLSRDYLEACANGQRIWTRPAFDDTATVVQEPANPGSEPVMNDDGSLSAYISDMGSENYFASRIKAGQVGTDGAVIDDGGFGDMSPSLSGTSALTVAAWVRLQEDLAKEAGEKVTPAEQKQLLNSTEIMVATTTDGGNSWTPVQLTDNASADLAPVTASNGSSAAVFWRGVYTTSDDPFPEDKNTKLTFDTQDVIYFRHYDGAGWGDAKMVYNGSSGEVVGIQSAMLQNGTSIVVFTVDRGSVENDAIGYELFYRTIKADGTPGDLVALTRDSEIDTNPQVAAVSDSGTDYFVLGWYSTQDDGDIRLQAVGADGQLYGGGSPHAVPASVKAITGEDGLTISSDFRFAKSASQGIDGLSLVWAETANDADGKPDHSVLYGTQLCQIDGKLYLSSPQALITLPARTLTNSFSAVQDSSGGIRAYLFGTWYSPTDTEYIEGYDTPVPVDVDKLLTGGGSFVADSVSVDSISVDYADLQPRSLTPVLFTLRNTGITKLTDLAVTIDSYTSNSVTLNPGESATVTVLYKTGDPIENPDYKVTAGGTELAGAGGTLYLDYNDLGISSMQMVSENEGKRTVRLTLYNDAAAKLEGSGRTVDLSFYTDQAHNTPADITLEGTQTGVSATDNTITLSDEALRRIDQGSMTLLVTFDLAGYVTGPMAEEEEVPASGVYLYASAEVKDGSGTAMAEYATGNNNASVQFTGAYARTGEKTTLSVTMTNGTVTEARVDLTNNCLQAQPDAGTLLAVLLDADGNALESKTVLPDSALTCEQTRSVNVTFEKLGTDVIVLYSEGGTGLQELRFSGMDVELSDFVLVEDETDPNHGNYVYTLPVEAPDSTVVSFISDEAVTVNGTEYDKTGSVNLSIPEGPSTITVTTGETTYLLILQRDKTPSGGDGDGDGGGGSGTLFYTLTFRTDGGSTISSLTKPSGTTIDLTEYVPTKEGYFFGGWYNEAALTNRLTSVTLKSNKSVYAKWIKNPFADVTLGAWFYDAVGYVYQNELMMGTDANLFSPDLTTTRGMIVTILHRLENSPTVADTSNFTDVENGSWYADAVNWAAANGIVGGYGDGTFGPDDPITREQMATIFYRYAQFKGYDVSVGESTSLLPYTDFADLSEYAIPAMQWAVGAGIISGTDTNTLSPRGDTTRAQVATILMRFLNTYLT